jgi:hypothetical protein
MAKSKIFSSTDIIKTFVEDSELAITFEKQKYESIEHEIHALLDSYFDALMNCGALYFVETLAIKN